ncbi:MAG: MFS transporter [Actinomycetota bacterium]
MRLLMVLLGTATFFEGYDTGISAIVIPDLARSFHASTATIGRAAAVVNLGALLALFVIAAGDRFGRRPLLIATTLIYALFTGLTAFAHSLVLFAAIQLLARIFLVTELAVAITIATEEFPAARRGRIIGSLSALGAVGLITVAFLYRFLTHAAGPGGAPAGEGWRGLYLVGTIPLLAVAPLRLKLRESRRFVQAKASGGFLKPTSLRRLIAGPYRKRLITASGVLFLFNFAVLSGAAYWTLFARNERGLTANQANTFLAAAVVLGVPGYLLAGWLQDRWGRRRTGTLFLLVGMVSGMAAFQVQGRPLMFLALAGGVFFGLGATPVVSTLAAELFPTEIRATSLAIARSVFGTLGASGGLLVVGFLASQHGPVGSVGNSMPIAALALIPAVILLWRLPETARRELESLALE